MKRRLKKILKVLGLLALAFVLLLAVLYTGWDIWSRRTLAAAKERLRASGLPLTVDDIRPPTVPDADNAALVMDKLTPLLKPLVNSADGNDLFVRMSKFNAAHPAYRLDAAGTQELAAMLDAAPVREVLALLDEATAKKGYDAKMKLELGPFLIIPNLADFPTETDLLCWRARLESNLAQADAGCAAVWKIFSLAEFLESEPTLISQLVRIQLWHKAAGELEKLMFIGAVTPEWNEKFTTKFSQLDIMPGFARSIDGERIGMGDYVFTAMLERKKFQKIALDSLDQETKGLFKGSFLYPKPLLRVEYAYYLDLFRQLETALAVSADDSWEKWFSAWHATQRLPKFGVVIRVIIPALGGVPDQLRKEQMRVKVAQVGLALERYRVANGGYPATLADLVPDFIKQVPLDVFTGQPLHYRTEPGGAVVHSVGPNLADDGGIEDKEADKDDLGWFAGTAAARRFSPVAGTGGGYGKTLTRRVGRKNLPAEKAVASVTGLGTVAGRMPAPTSSAPQDQIHSESFLRLLMRRQLKLSVACAATFLVVLLGLPLLNYFFPAFMATRVMGFTLTWLILGVLFFPFVWVISFLFIKRSIALEDDEVKSVKQNKP